MNATHRPFLATLALGVSLLAATSSAQVRIDAIPWVIDAPGSYILVDDLVGDEGITIAASHVTLDLNGYSLRGTPRAAGDGVYVRGNQVGLEVRNGVISGWPERGIMGDAATASLFSDLRLGANGLCGLRAGETAVVENVVARHNRGTGIVGFESTLVTDCVSADNLGFGVEVGTGGVVNGLSIVGNGAGGIFAGDAGRITENVLESNGWLLEGDGSEGASGCFVATGFGVSVVGSGTLVQDNVFENNVYGLQLLMGGNTIAGNLVRGSAPNYFIEPGNNLNLVLAELPERIEWPASVTLAGTLMGVSGQPGVVLASDDITFDLGGHCLAGVPGSLDGILVEGERVNIMVRNGITRFWGRNGINAETSSNSQIQSMRSFHNELSGMRLGPGGTIVDTTSFDNELNGIWADEDTYMSGCSINDNGNRGIIVGPHSLVTDTVASENFSYGIEAADGGAIDGCTISRNLLGIEAGEGVSVRDCTASFNVQVGIRVGRNSLVSGNTVVGDPVLELDIGIQTLDGPGVHIEDNTVCDAAVGLSIVGTGNFATQNMLTGNTTPYVIARGNAYGEFVDLSGGGPLTDGNPWCNFIMTR